MGTYEQVNDGKHFIEPFDGDSVPSYLSKFSGIYEDPILFPRVGGQYQVEIPSLKTNSELCLLRSTLHGDVNMAAIENFGLGLAIPLNWVQYCSENAKMKYEKEDANLCVLNTKQLAHSHENNSSQVENNFSTYGSTFESQGHSRISEDLYPLPCLPTLSLSDAEKQSFVLGLYIFGKNLFLVKRFMETISMGEVLSFYYGKFYRSDAYLKWSESQKIRSRRSIHGQRIFTGWRQQELLSRVLNSVHKELEDTLLEAAKFFNEGRATLEEFVFKLKATAGLPALVEAIGIGRGAHDLTCVAMEQVKTNLTVPLHPEIPFGRACSFLTSVDIIKFLTGNFRLSKAKSNDLFWEAVWPRLLAKGWHSEQPRDQGLLAFKHSLVFLVPGVKKFSRKKLVKGIHFFDSVSDVLSKVASDQRLLELDVDGFNGVCSSIKESERKVEADVYQNGSSNSQYYCYLRPRHSRCSSERLKFTVVDTSAAHIEEFLKVVGVRSLPSEAISSYDISADSKDLLSESSSETGDSTDACDDEDGSILTSLPLKGPEFNLATQLEGSKASIIPASNASTINGYRPCYKNALKLREDMAVPLKCDISRKVRPGQSNSLPTATKRRKLAACSRVPDRQPCSVNQIQQTVETLFSNGSPFQERTNLYQLADSTRENGFVVQTKVSEKLQSLTFFDLNNPPADATETSSIELEDLPLHFLSEKQHTDSQVSARESIDILAEEQASAGIRRQSKRNRPPTAKALEALASGLLGSKRSWRPSNSTNRPSLKVKKTDDELPVSPTETNGSISSSTIVMIVAESVSKDYEDSVRKGASDDVLGVP